MFGLGPLVCARGMDLSAHLHSAIGFGLGQRFGGRFGIDVMRWPVRDGPTPATSGYAARGTLPQARGSGTPGACGCCRAGAAMPTGRAGRRVVARVRRMMAAPQAVTIQ